MPCTPTPSIPQPSLPFPYSVPPLPSPPVPADPGLCCQLPTFLPPVPPIPLPPGVLNHVTIGVLDAAMEAITTWADALHLDCPKD